MRIPIPDPLGILEELTGGDFYDPVRKAFFEPAREKAAPVATTPAVPPDLLSEEVKVDRYIDLLTQAYKVAPCKGCQTLVESAITGAEVYREMEKAGKTAELVKGDEAFMQGVKEKVRKRLEG